jgi:hypothetical protein
MYSKYVKMTRLALPLYLVLSSNASGGTWKAGSFGAWTRFGYDMIDIVRWTNDGNPASLIHDTASLLRQLGILK